MDKIDKLIDFYYEDIDDGERFHMRTMLNSFGVSCWANGINHGQELNEGIKPTYESYDEFRKDVNEKV